MRYCDINCWCQNLCFPLFENIRNIKNIKTNSSEHFPHSRRIFSAIREEPFHSAHRSRRQENKLPSHSLLIMTKYGTVHSVVLSSLSVFFNLSSFKSGDTCSLIPWYPWAGDLYIPTSISSSHLK